MKVWRDAHSMRAECAAHFPSAALISLDHDLNPMPGVTTDPGTGLDVAQFLGDFLPVCPVLIHRSNTDRVYSMHNELRFAGWMVDRVGPIGTDWIETSWLRSARRLLAEHSNTWKADLPTDHAVRVERMNDGAELDRKFQSLTAIDPRCKLKITGGVNRPPMERTEKIAALFQKARTYAEELGFLLEEKSTGGGSDGNFTAALGIPTLDGLGAVGEGAHALHESILLKHLAPRTALLARLVSGV